MSRAHRISAPDEKASSEQGHNLGKRCVTVKRIIPTVKKRSHQTPSRNERRLKQKRRKRSPLELLPQELLDMVYGYLGPIHICATDCGVRWGFLDPLITWIEVLKLHWRHRPLRLTVLFGREAGFDWPKGVKEWWCRSGPQFRKLNEAIRDDPGLFRKGILFELQDIADGPDKCEVISRLGKRIKAVKAARRKGWRLRLARDEALKNAVAKSET
ncbi:hypothetical protein LTR97_001405 [Elasticomyces elasticus]|uniref:Uncharacterized protein n=1 Tax=Elasticomyces elasticus TaxID=574655 RepID=A0AAN7WQF6_9PEZI|nr:hypothetical protein LTR97_001405 [Elasticomyces elasticus]